MYGLVSGNADLVLAGSDYGTQLLMLLAVYLVQNISMIAWKELLASLLLSVWDCVLDKPKVCRFLNAEVVESMPDAIRTVYRLRNEAELI